MRRAHLGGALAAICVLAALAIAGCGGSGGGSATDSASKPRVVNISEYTYKPETISASAGTKLTFVNHDSTAHTATAKQQGAFDTQPIQPGKSATVTLSEAGKFTYYCVFHPFMKGTVEVE
jgi:plastocyanin